MYLRVPFSCKAGLLLGHHGGGLGRAASPDGISDAMRGKASCMHVDCTDTTPSARATPRWETADKKMNNTKGGGRGQSVENQWGRVPLHTVYYSATSRMGKSIPPGVRPRRTTIPSSSGRSRGVIGHYIYLGADREQPACRSGLEARAGYAGGTHLTLKGAARR